MPIPKQISERNKLDDILTDLEGQRAEIKKKYDRSILWHFLLPGIGFGATAIFMLLPPLIFVVTAALGLASYGIYRQNIGSPFDEIKNQLKAAVLSEFMKTFHPEIVYTYYAHKHRVKAIAKSSDLVSANRYEEEDVIQGKYGNTQFYISEVHLKNKSDKSTRTVLDGLLLKINIPGKKFPHSRIQSEPGILSKLFGGYKEHPDYGFYYDTSNETKFLSELESLFPFIRHLMAKQGDVRISIKNDEIIMFMESDMQLLDDPEPSLHTSFKNKAYNENIARQMNTLLFIVESFAKGLSNKDVEERLELESLKLVEKIQLRNQ